MEIGPDFIRMVLLESHGRGAGRPANVYMQAIPPFAEINSPLVAQALRTGLTALAGGSRGLDIWVGLSVDRVRVHHLVLPKMKPSQLVHAVYWALQREDSFSDKEILFDFEVEREIAQKERTDLAITGFLLPREDRDSLVKLFREAGYPLRGITLPLYAIRNIFRSGIFPDNSKARVFSHIGVHSSRIGVWAGGRSILTRGIPIGIEPIVNELVSLLHPAPDPETAVRMILDLGKERWQEHAYDPEQVFQTMQPALDRIARQIDRTLEYYQLQLPGSEPVDRVFLSGTIAESPRCCEYLDNQIGVPLEVLDPFRPDRNDSQGSVPEDPADRRAFAPAFGLALSSDDRCPNFFNTFEDRQRHSLHRRANVGIFAFFFVLAALLGAYYGHQRSTLEELRAERARMEARVQNESPLLSTSDVLTRIAAVRDDFSGVVATLDRYLAVAVLSELSELTPSNVRLQNVSAFLGQPTTDENGARDPWLRISGVVSGDSDLLEADLSLYRRQLAASPLFFGVRLRESDIQHEAGEAHLRFSLELSISPVTEGGES